MDHLPNNALPMRSEPHDDLRYGLSTLKEEAAVSHPVEALERTRPKEAWDSREKMLRSVYGSALPARLQIERQILGRVQRLPGIPSARLGLESLSGELDDFHLTSFIGANDESEIPQPNLHGIMEARLGMVARAPERELA